MKNKSNFDNAQKRIDLLIEIATNSFQPMDFWEEVTRGLSKDAHSTLSKNIKESRRERPVVLVSENDSIWNIAGDIEMKVGQLRSFLQSLEFVMFGDDHQNVTDALIEAVQEVAKEIKTENQRLYDYCSEQKKKNSSGLEVVSV